MLSGDNSFAIIGKMLDGCAKRHEIIAANLANTETPGYKRIGVQFEKQLAQAIGRNDRTAIEEVTPETGETPGLKARADGNNVDFGFELGEMTRNTLVFSTFAQLAASRIRRYREAIGG